MPGSMNASARLLCSLLVGACTLGPSLVKAAPAEPASVAAADPASDAVAQGRLDEAVAIYEQRRAADAKDAASREWLVKLYMWTERAETAIPVLEELVALDPKNEERVLQLAQFYIWFGRANEAIPLFEQVAAANPKDKKIRARLIEANLWYSRADAALKVYAELYAIEPDDVENALAYAKLLIQNGRSEEAIPIYEKLSKDDPTNEAHLEQLILLYGWNSKGKALLVGYEKLYALRSSNLDLASKLAQQYEWNGRGAEAIPLLEQVLAKRPDDLEIRVRLARQLAGNERADEAAEHLQYVVDHGGADVDSRFLLAQITHWSPDWMVAKDQYQEILAEDPAHEGANKYGELLAAAHGPKFSLGAEAFRDTNDVTRFTEDLTFDAAVASPVRLGVAYKRRDFFERHYALGRLRSAENRYTAYLAIASGWFTGRVEAGAQTFMNAPTEPYVSANMAATIKQKVTLGVDYGHERFSQGVLSIREPVDRDQFGASLVLTPVPWFAASAAGKLSVMSDDNVGRLLFTGAWFKPYRERFLLTIGGTAGHESYRWLYPDALPYFTAQVWAFAPGVDVGYRHKDVFRAEVGYSTVFDLAGNVIHTPRAKVLWNITPRNQLSVAYHRWGSPVYGYHLGIARFTHRFGFARR